MCETAAMQDVERELRSFGYATDTITTEGREAIVVMVEGQRHPAATVWAPENSHGAWTWGDNFEWQCSATMDAQTVAVRVGETLALRRGEET